MSQAVVVSPASVVRERLQEFVGEVSSGLRHVAQRRHAVTYVRGMIDGDGRKSLEPTVVRLGDEEVGYQAMQQFIADSPWDHRDVMRAIAEHVCPQIEPEALVLDDTGFVKDGKHSPGVKRQYSGTLGKIGNCQIGVSVHAVGRSGTLPLGWALYLPEEWCADLGRRRKAKIPDDVAFKTKAELGFELAAEAAKWNIEQVPLLGDQAYGDDSGLRGKLDDLDLGYVLSLGMPAKVFDPDTNFHLKERVRTAGRPPSKLLADCDSSSLEQFARSLEAEDFQELAIRKTKDHDAVSSRFAAKRVIAAHPVTYDGRKPRQEWLIIEWPKGEKGPTNYWISNLPEDTQPEELARLAKLRWMIELDYKQLKGHLGLDHYEGRSYAGWYHHTALVSVAHAFLTLERINPKAKRLV